MFAEETTTAKVETENKELKTVFLIGDSIRIGYCEHLRDLLKDVANVIFPKENCRNTQYTYVTLSNWINMVENPLNVSVVYWNNGHWDVSHWANDERSLNTIEHYNDMLLRIHNRLKKAFPNAKIVFSTTTTMNPDGSQGENIRSNQEIQKYNAAAVTTLSEKGVLIHDLFGFTQNFSSEYYADYCHFSETGFKLIAEHICDFLTPMI